jgi:HSP20 family protein
MTNLLRITDRFFPAFEQEVNTFFNSIFRGPSCNRAKSANFPKVDISVENGKYKIRAATPGVKKEDLTVEQEENVVRISGQMDATHQDNSESYHYKELVHSRFTRSFTLPEGVEGDAKATYQDGVLTLEWDYKDPKEPEAKPRVITIT